MSKPYDSRLIMMVAQRSFETTDLNQFCKLVPIIYVDGGKPAAADFPNDGEVWWMLTPQSARLASPGQLVIGSIENAVRYEVHDPNSSQYQVKRDSLQELGLKDGLEVIDLPGAALDNIQDVVSGGFQVDLAARPVPSVMLRWRQHVYGPFIAAAHSASAASRQQVLTFLPANADMTVFKVEESKFSDATRGHRVQIADKVSLTSNRRTEGVQLAPVAHDLVLASGYERLLATNPHKLVLEPIDRKLARYAKQCLSRKKRQEFLGLLKELEVTGREGESAAELVEAIGQIKQVTGAQEEALDVVAKALLASGLLGEDRIAKAERDSAEQYVQERIAELQAKADKALSANRDELRRVESELQDIQATIQKEESQRRARLDQEMAAEREQADRELAADREDFEKQKIELQRQQSLLQKNLEKVTKDLREAGDEVVNRFLTIAPLLGSLGLANAPAAALPTTAAADQGKGQPAPFEIPAFVTGAATARDEALSEDAFVDRFRRVVEDSGFVYRPLDLQRFHLSVKCGEITILGGPSGTGKSSLPALYARALVGADNGTGRVGCLMVNVNPSWMDTRDLLGHMNTLEGRFYPAESGLFQHLIFAHEEHQARGPACGMCLTCLDEMNLSQIEHYFSDFMMVLERSGSARAIHCFSPAGSSNICPFRKWGRVNLSPAVRFVGTVNFDETTRLLSDRFLDRVNLIRLKSAALPGVAGLSGSLAAATGRLVTLADMESWRADGALPPDLGSLLDQIRPLLNQMGCPLSPRVYRGICRFVGSAPKILAPAKAFDIQVTQRVISRIRSLVTRRQLDALDQLLQILNHSSACAFEESIPLVEEIREAASSRDWDLED